MENKFCIYCNKKLRSTNTTGFCYTHRDMSLIRKQQKKDYKHTEKYKAYEKQAYLQKHPRSNKFCKICNSRLHSTNKVGYCLNCRKPTPQHKMCPICSKQLSTSNTIGYCFKHSDLSPIKKQQRADYKKLHQKEISEKERLRQSLKRPKIEKGCPTCNIIFFTSNSLKKYCSNKCCEKANYINRDKKQKKAHHKERMKADPAYKIRIRIRERIRAALKYGKVPNHKAYSKTALVGCNAYTLKKHLEAQFKPGMSWENYGVYGWHVDHIIPLAAFDLSNKEELKKAGHYTNLQPLWAEDNLKKGAKI